MATHSLAIAKASLAAAMMRPDPIALPRTEIAQLHTYLDALLEQCSTTNIQLCKNWLLKNVISSAARTIAIGNYLAVLSASFTPANENHVVKPTEARHPSARRKRLHILYLLNDLLHHTKYHIEQSSVYSVLMGNLQSYLVDVFGTASAYSKDVYVRHHKKLCDLLDHWEENHYYQPPYISKLRDTINNTAELSHRSSGSQVQTADAMAQESTGQLKKDPPYIMPPSHGDLSTPFYDLPAGNIMPHIIPNSGTPIHPQLVKPLQFVTGPADQNLVIAVQGFLKDVESVDGVDAKDETLMDIDELGQIVLRDEISGDIVGGEGYYGWSRTFCERMKRRITGRSLHESENGSRSPRKRRRYSDSQSSGSRSRSPSRPRLRGDLFMEQSRKPSNSPRSASRSKSRSSSYSPPMVLAGFQQTQVPEPSPLQQTEVHERAPSQTHPFPLPFSQGSPLAPGGVPIPPPPPPNFIGVWPPPPPPLPQDLRSQGVQYPILLSQPFPGGPATFQNYGPPTMNLQRYQNQEPPSNFNGWGQQQQQQIPAWGSGLPNGGFDGGRGRGYGYDRGRARGRGGWSR